MITRTDPMILYGANGNIVGITRKGKTSSNSYGLMDNLTLSYDGNRLTGVSETVSDYDFTGSFEYKKANGSQYIYNSNGSLVADRSRNIAYITYDANNNPQTIYFTNGNEIRYTYSGTGEKLCAKYYNAVPNVTRAFGVKPEGYPQSQIMCVYQYDYILGGSMVMYNGMIDKVLFDGGYAKAERINSTAYGYTLFYYNKDHLGNNREVVNYSGNVQQLTNYYPFGAPYTDPRAVMSASLQPYKYNGKELVTMHGLNTYDYGARQYDPILCRWDRVDPLCEKYYAISPYAYCANSPIMFVDLHGDSLTIDEQSVLAIYNGLEDGSHVHMKFNNGVLDPSSISDVASNSNDTFLQDLYEIANDSRMVELCTNTNNRYLMNGQIISEEWNTPYELDDNDLDKSALSLLRESGQPIGRHIQGNLGQTLFSNYGIKRSTNGNIQIIINSKGNINAQSIGIAHEFAHVLLYLRGKPSGHGEPGVDEFVYGRATMMSKRLGYDY